MIDQRLAAAQQLAQNVQGLNFTQQGQELQRQGIAGSLATQAAGTATTALTNPLLQILGLAASIRPRAEAVPSPIRTVCKIPT